MNCQSVQSRLSAFQDGELAAEMRSNVARHIGECAACRGELQSLQQLHLRLNALPEIEPAPRFSQTLMAQLRPMHRRKWQPLPSIVYTFTILVVFSLGLLISPPAVDRQASTQAAPAQGQQLTSLLLEGDTMQLLSVQKRSLDFLKAGSHE